MLGNTDLDLDQSHVAYLNFLKYYNYSVEALNERRGEKRIDLRLVQDRSFYCRLVSNPSTICGHAFDCFYHDGR